MQRKGIVNGVNQDGKAATEEELSERKPAKRRSRGLTSWLLKMLNAFGNFVSPINDDSQRK